ncbi:hypothetical protein SBI67_01855 [Mycolicibacterium sp. 120266]|uniref:hypothetical protein n=1 Tax=Mycolicibacterium sp. 120266 TaxID=3090601 RepID=UPI00299DDCC0|nr:hypothetical protein [Mycolicibacterium sp. 120266]MDX1870853.1 hypothetical protein [Mycolicibacterium sp. 120266]
MFVFPYLFFRFIGIYPMRRAIQLGRFFRKRNGRSSTQPMRFRPLYIGFSIIVAARLEPIDEMAAEPVIERADYQRAGNHADRSDDYLSGKS